jgi:hypothetical protein
MTSFRVFTKAGALVTLGLFASPAVAQEPTPLTLNLKSIPAQIQMCKPYMCCPVLGGVCPKRFPTAYLTEKEANMIGAMIEQFNNKNVDAVIKQDSSPN